MKGPHPTTPGDLDSMLLDLFRPQPPPAALTRRLAAGALRKIRDLEGLVSELSIDANERGVTAVRRGFGGRAAGRAARHFVEQAREELTEYMQGERSYFSVPIDLSGLAPFQGRVLRETIRIPFGETRSYSGLARTVGHPGAARAVGTALGRNPIPLIVPCHRVLRGDGSMGGYGLGVKLKRRLLYLERTTPVLEGCDSTRIVCRVGCPALRRSRPDHRVVFASVSDARSVGYHSCAVCRP